MERRIYQITESEQKKLAKLAGYDWESEINAQRPTDTKSKAFRKWSMRKRDAALRAMRNTPDYFSGKGQGALDLACGLQYAEKTDNRAYNCGYHNGYTNSSNLRDLKTHNPNFAFLGEQGAI